MSEEIRFLTAEDILTADDLAEKIVDVPEWKGRLKVKAFSRGKLHEVRRAASKPNGKGGTEIDEQALDVMMFIYGVIGPDGTPLFQPEHFALLSEKSAAGMQRVLKEIMALSGLGEDAVKEADEAFQE